METLKIKFEDETTTYCQDDEKAKNIEELFVQKMKVKDLANPLHIGNSAAEVTEPH